MFAHILALIETRRRLNFLLTRADDHLLDDIGLNRAEAEAMLNGTAPLRRLSHAGLSFPVDRHQPCEVA